MRSTVLAATVALALTGMLLSGCGRSQMSTHHALIKIRMDPHGMDGGPDQELRRDRVEDVLPVLASVLHASGLSLVTDTNTPFSTTRFSSREEQVLRYQATASGDTGSKPLEALIAVDSVEYEELTVALSEGYSVEPTERISNLYAKLDETLAAIEGDKYVSRLW